MFEKILNDKSEVKIEEGKWQIDTNFSEYNQCGSMGRDDLIRRRDAIQLLGEMNIKLANVYEMAKQKHPELADELLQATSVLSYAMWGIREIEPAKIIDSVIIGESNCASTKRNYNKMAMISDILAGKDVVIVDDGEEYKSLGEELGIEYKKANSLIKNNH